MIKNSKKKSIMLIIAFVMAITSLLSSVNSNSPVVNANGLDPASKILCKFDDGQEIVRFHSTDYFHYLFRSKSAVTTLQPVDSSWLNKLLELTGHDFTKVNEEILGRPLKPLEAPETTIEDANKNAPKVSAFDRFGVAGLKWSSYQGEWKYYHINPCAQQDNVSPTTFGTFYEDRLEPQSTHNETPTSIDPRSIQFNKSVGSLFLSAFMDTISNALFSITKTIITLTIVFVGLSFTDITAFFGMLDETGSSGTTATGIFTSLFDSLFSGLVIIAVIFSAATLIYRGLIKRELRFALNSILKTGAVFIIAIVMASNPSYWVGMPNKIATYGQALIFNSMSSVYAVDEGQASLCDTNVASIDDNVSFDLSNTGLFKGQFEQVNENMRSMIACNMWQTFLLEPWAKGQFGADYKDLGSDSVNNNNESWVGSPTVPVGNGLTIDNWALFQISTQTNAHAPIGPDSISTIVNGVNADWWRIVDALSDYEEEKEIVADEDGNEHEFSEPVKKETTEHWQSWVGNNRAERFGVAIISIIFGIMGSIAPLIFGFASAMFGLSLTLLTMTAPIFLLFGVWGGKGDGIFLGWLGALANTVIKKVAAGLLLMLSLALSMSVMNMLSEIGFITSFFLMGTSALVLVKNKDKLFSIMANVDFGGAFDPRERANQIWNTQKQSVREAGKTTAAALGGAVAARESGQSVIGGAKVGIARQLRNRMYTSRTGANIIRQMEVEIGGDKITNHTCINCHKPLGSNGKLETAYKDDDGNYYCVYCAEEMGLEKLYETTVGAEVKKKSARKAFANPNEIIETKDKRSIVSTTGASWIGHRDFKYTINQRNVNGEYQWDNESVQKAIMENIENVQKDFVVFKNVQMRLKTQVDIPSAPEPLHEYIDLPLLNIAWADGRFDVIESTYKEAWKMWYEDNAQYVSGMTEEETEEFKNEVDKLDFNVSQEEARSLMDNYYRNHMNVTDRAKEEEVYGMRDGKIKLYDVDIDETNKRLSD